MKVLERKFVRIQQHPKSLEGEMADMPLDHSAEPGLDDAATVNEFDRLLSRLRLPTIVSGWSRETGSPRPRPRAARLGHPSIRSPAFRHRPAASPRTSGSRQFRASGFGFGLLQYIQTPRPAISSVLRSAGIRISAAAGTIGTLLQRIERCMETSNWFDYPDMAFTNESLFVTFTCFRRRRQRVVVFRSRRQASRCRRA